jgi:hypothetical protein
MTKMFLKGTVSLPLVCPECRSTTVVDVMGSALVQDLYGWDKTNGRYVFGSSDCENFGELYLECGVCDHRYSQEAYDAFIESCPVQK